MFFLAPQLVKDFHVSEEVATLPLAVFMCVPSSNSGCHASNYGAHSCQTEPDIVRDRSCGGPCQNEGVDASASSSPSLPTRYFKLAVHWHQTLEHFFLCASLVVSLPVRRCR